MKYCQNKDYGIIFTQIGVVVFEIQSKKLEVAKSRKRCEVWTTFVKVLEAAKILACNETFLKSRFIVMGKLQVLYIQGDTKKNGHHQKSNNFQTFMQIDTKLQLH